MKVEGLRNVGSTGHLVVPCVGREAFAIRRRELHSLEQHLPDPHHIRPFNLAYVDGGVNRGSEIKHQICRKDLCLSGEKIDLNLGGRSPKCLVHEILDGWAVHGHGGRLERGHGNAFERLGHDGRPVEGSGFGSLLATCGHACSESSHSLLHGKAACFRCRRPTGSRCVRQILGGEVCEPDVGDGGGGTQYAVERRARHLAHLGV
mmetsp:Transcript_57971/g.136632  ORF Transcript_57971/g.136632 Transcript_57971/m.136632 type:complete len:205 (-) Transcript_57971:819-1433(-)